MVAARVAFLATGHYQRIADAVSNAIPDGAQGLCLDVAGGTGYYLSVVPQDSRHSCGCEVSDGRLTCMFIADPGRRIH